MDVHSERRGRIATAPLRHYFCQDHGVRSVPWMLPEKPWSRLHLDHAINFVGTNVMVGNGGRLLQVPLHSPNQFYFN